MTAIMNKTRYYRNVSRTNRIHTKALVANNCSLRFSVQRQHDSTCHLHAYDLDYHLPLKRSKEKQTQLFGSVSRYSTESVGRLWLMNSNWHVAIFHCFCVFFEGWQTSIVLPRLNHCIVIFCNCWKKSKNSLVFWNPKMETKISAEKSVITYNSIRRQIPDESHRNPQLLWRQNANKSFRKPRDRTEILFVDKKSPLMFFSTILS